MGDVTVTAAAYTEDEVYEDNISSLQRRGYGLNSNSINAARSDARNGRNYMLDNSYYHEKEPSYSYIPSMQDELIGMPYAFSRDINPFEDAEVYVNLFLKSEVSRAGLGGKGKLTVPIIGGQVGVNTNSGGRAAWIQPQNTYMSYEVGNSEYKVIPVKDSNNNPLVWSDWSPQARCMYKISSGKIMSRIYGVPIHLADYKIQGELQYIHNFSDWKQSKLTVGGKYNVKKSIWGDVLILEGNVGIRIGLKIPNTFK